MPKKTAHEVAVNALLSEAERAEYARRVQALRSRNALLTMLETAREDAGVTQAHAGPPRRPGHLPACDVC